MYPIGEAFSLLQQGLAGQHIDRLDVGTNRAVIEQVGNLHTQITRGIPLGLVFWAENLLDTVGLGDMELTEEFARNPHRPITYEWKGQLLARITGAVPSSTIETRSKPALLDAIHKHFAKTFGTDSGFWQESTHVMGYRGRVALASRRESRLVSGLYLYTGLDHPEVALEMDIVSLRNLVQQS